MKKWQRPITTRRYLHPPKSERMYTIWSEGKVVFGEIFAPNGIENYSDYTSSGIWFVTGTPDGQMDFHGTRNVIRDDGVPVHEVIRKVRGMEIGVEAFSSFERKPICFVRLSVSNISDIAISDKIGFVLRTAKENVLIKDGPDIYRSYAPEISAWLSADSTWKEDDGAYYSEDNCISVYGNIDFKFDAEIGAAMADVRLEPGEKATAYFAYGTDGAISFDYEAEKQKSVDLWNRELSKIKNIPDALKSDSESVKMIRHLVATILQNFNCPKGENFLLARQGGLSRMMWTYESMPVLEALSGIGDFGEYVEPILDMYFNECQSDDGEVVPFGIHWAMSTANALCSFSKYAILKNEDYFLKYRDKLLLAYSWINSQRLKTAEGGMIAGLFPPRRANDDESVFQAWANTDMNNLDAFRNLTKLLEHFGDPMAAEVRRETDGYYEILQGIWRGIVDRTGDTDELSVPLTADGDDAWLKKNYVFREPLAYVPAYLNPTDEEVGKILNYYTRRNVIKGGLYNRMPDKYSGESTTCNLDADGKCVVWYVSVHETIWFGYYMRRGMRDKAKEIIDANSRYAMTEEYYMIERYHEDDPYFCPWSPNASANGRTINMLLEYYGQN